MRRKFSGRNKILRNKRGEGDQIVGVNAIELVILGLIIIAVFIFVYNYIFHSESQEVQAVENTLDSIEGKINALKEGQSTSFILQGREEWALMGWSSNEGGRPTRCLFSSCICMCKIGVKYPFELSMESLMVGGGVDSFNTVFKKSKIFFAKEAAKDKDSGKCENPQTGFCRKIKVNLLDVCMVTNRANMLNNLKSGKIGNAFSESFKKEFGVDSPALKTIADIVKTGKDISTYPLVSALDRYTDGMSAINRCPGAIEDYLYDNDDLKLKDNFQGVAMIPFRSNFIEIKITKKGDSVLITSMDYIEDDKVKS